MAIERVEVRREMAVDAKKVWEVISRINGVDQWFPTAIQSCRVEGSGEGSKRYCTMDGGVRLIEQIEKIDAGKMVFGFLIEDNSALPATAIHETMRLRALGDNRTELVWSAEYQPRADMPGAMKKMLEEVYPAGIQSLEAYCKNA